MSRETNLNGTKRKRSDVAEKVAQRWKSVRYSAEMENMAPVNSNNDSDDCIIVSESKIIDLTNQEQDLSERIGTNDTAKGAVFKLMKSDFYEREDFMGEVEDMITLKDIFGTETLKRSILFSFQYELDFLLRQFHQNVENITIVGQKGTIMPIEARAMDATLAVILKKVKLIEITMPPFASHHTKLIINFYDNGECKIFLPSNNFTSMETNLPQQVCWCSPLLKIGKEGLPVPFKRSLIEYLNSYHLKDIDELITKA